MKNLWYCKEHLDKEIAFVCVGNAWHFQPLCNTCVPQHTKNHPKNIKLQFEGLKQTSQKAIKIKQQVSSIYQKRLQLCKKLIQIPKNEYQYLKLLEQKRGIVIKQINLCFDNLIKDVKKIRQEQEIQQNKSLKKLTQTLQESITFFKNQEYPSIYDFCKEIKKYYFKENLQVYVQEYDQIITDFKLNTVQYCPFNFTKDINTLCSQFIKQIVKINQTNQIEQKNEKLQPIKKYIKKKEPVKKKCGHCGQQMQYLTEWKKHLICRNCGGKQRNYIKK